MPRLENAQSQKSATRVARKAISYDSEVRDGHVTYSLADPDNAYIAYRTESERPSSRGHALTPLLRIRADSRKSPWIRSFPLC